MMTYRPHFFVDLHGTLVTRTLRAEVMESLVAFTGYRADRIASEADKVQPGIDLGLTSLSTAWRSILTSLGDHARVAARAERCAAIILDGIQPYPMAREMLSELSNRGRVVLASNTGYEAFHASVNALGIQGVDCLTSCDLKIRKPDHAFFSACLFWLGQEHPKLPSRTLKHVLDDAHFIDDSPANVDRARAVGFTAVWSSTPVATLDTMVRILEKRKGES